LDHAQELPDMTLSHLCRGLLAAVFALVPLTVLSAENVTITISPVLPDPNVVRAGADQATSLVTVLGETVTVTGTAGREYTLRSVGGLAGTQFDTQPTEGEVIRITPQAAEDGGYLLRIEASRWQAGRQSSFSSTVAAAPGEWVRLRGTEEVASPGVRRYGTRVLDETLYVMVR
jgi:hypothetical protein